MHTLCWCIFFTTFSFSYTRIMHEHIFSLIHSLVHFFIAFCQKDFVISDTIATCTLNHIKARESEREKNENNKIPHIQIRNLICNQLESSWAMQVYTIYNIHIQITNTRKTISVSVSHTKFSIKKQKKNIYI